MARIITITSGKGGVGKTSISLNLSLSLASKGFKVCLFDADLGLANVNILTGIYPKKDIESVITGLCSLNEIIIKDFQGIDIIPGASGVKKIANLSQTQIGTLISAFLDLEEYDYFIFDTSAGISSQVISFCMASHEIILVATCEPTSLTDAYSMLKVLSKHGYDWPVKVVINQVKSGKAAQKAYTKLKETVNRFLSLKLQPLGIMAADKNVRAAVISQTPFFMLFPDTLASKCIKSISRKLIEDPDQHGDMPLELFWDKCLTFLAKHSKPVIETATLKEPEKQPDKQAPKTTASKTQVKHDLEIKKTLESIESKISSLIKDVSHIKQFLKKETKIKNLPEPKKIPLDFESWLKKNSS